MIISFEGKIIVDIDINKISNKLMEMIEEVDSNSKEDLENDKKEFKIIENIENILPILKGINISKKIGGIFMKIFKR